MSPLLVFYWAFATFHASPQQNPSLADKCLNVICDLETNCTQSPCRTDSEGREICGYFNLNIYQYRNCYSPGKRSGDSENEDFRRCANDRSCSASCIRVLANKSRTKCNGIYSECERISRIYHAGVEGCRNSMQSGEGSSSEANKSEVKSELTDEQVEHVARNNISLIVPIKCGELKANLHFQLFLCPGIHQKCIEYKHEPELISPKEFTMAANRSAQKDWKKSIRIENSSIRTLMESKKFDFYNHSNFCSGNCQSRNHIVSNRENLALATEGRTLEHRASVGAPLTILTSPPKTQLNPTLGALIKNPKLSQYFQQLDSPNALLAGIQNFTKEEQAKIVEETNKLCEKMTEDPCFFWSEMDNYKIIEQIVDMMIEALNEMRTKLKNGGVSEVAPCLTTSIASFGICDRLRAAVIRRNALIADAYLRLAQSGQQINTEFLYAGQQSIGDQQLEATGSEAFVARQAQQMIKIEPPESSFEEKPVAFLKPTQKRSISEQHLKVKNVKKERIDEEFMGTSAPSEPSSSTKF